MLIALGLIVIAPFAFIYTFVFLTNTVIIPVTEWADGQAYDGELSLHPLPVAIIVLGGLAVQYRLGPWAVQRSINAHLTDPDRYPELHGTVARLSAQVDIEPPAIGLVANEAPNAFAVAGGGRPRIIVTTALLEELDDDELEAVLAHELAHLTNRDANLMTVAWLLPTITYYLAILAFYVLYGLYRVGIGFSGGSSGGDGGGGDGRAVAVAIIVITVCAIVTVTVSAMFWAVSVLFYRVLSRQREYAADRAAATITGSPAALAGALETIDETMADVPDRDLRRLDGGAEALYLAPLEARDFGSKELVSTDIFPETHPPTEERIERLRDLERDG